MLIAWLTMWAQTQPQGQGQPQEPSWGPLMLPLGLLLIFYLVMVRPMQRQERLRREKINTGLKKNDKVVTQAGIYGTVVSIKEGEDQVALKIDDSSNVRMWVTKSSIAQILTPEDKKDKDSKDKDSKDKDSKEDEDKKE